MKDSDFADRFVLDYEQPDYIVAATHCFDHRDYCERLRRYLRKCPNSIFVSIAGECLEADLNIFDYVLSWRPDLVCADRVTRIIPSAYSLRNGNDLSHAQAENFLQAKPKFCNFIYSHPEEPRDTFFHQLSGYKRVDSLGPHLHNTDVPDSRNAPNWYQLSIDMKLGYKFSMAMENATYRGYTTEKIITSLRAHTVPIYWGDPTVAELINPKAFVNCHDYASFDEVIERVREIDNNDDLWLDMITQEWQTEEQKAKTQLIVDDYEAFMRNIFTQDIRTARRRPVGAYGTFCLKGWTGYVGVMPPLYLRAFRKLRRLIGKCLPRNLKLRIKKALHMD